MHRAWGLAASFALHTVIALWVLWPTHAPVAPAESVQPSALQVVALPGHKNGILLDVEDRASNCAAGNTYLGIGLQFNLDQIVTVVPKTYPAYKAGIRPGDTVLNPDFEPDVDGYDIVAFTRRGRHHRLRIKAQWICLR